MNTNITSKIGTVQKVILKEYDFKYCKCIKDS